MLYYLATVVFAFFGLVLWYWRQSRRSIAYLPGPPSTSWLVGNLPTFERTEDAADAHFEWTKKYGNAFRVKGCFGEDVLYLSDPKAMQYVFNTSGYNFPKTWEHRILITLATGRGVVAVEGEQHARQRRVMNPSFSNSALKGYLPTVFAFSRKTTAAWTATIRKQSAETAILNVAALLSRTTLDIIGEVAFGYKFNAIEDADPKTELHQAYANIFVDAHFNLPDSEVVFRRLLGYAPDWIVDVLTSIPKKDFQRLNNYMRIARSVARGLVEKQTEAHATGKKGASDVMSIFVRANSAEDPRRRLEEDEIVPQITTLMIAGHETSANTLSWVLYELAKHPEVQSKLRDEVRSTRLDLAARGVSEMSMSDLESMKYLGAVVRETLRYHPIITQLFRRAGHDDAIPLGTPQQTASGDPIIAVPVRKGQIVQLGLASYNRLESIWGEDAHEWRPERFFEELPNEQKINLGVTGNICTFSSGLRSCLGWRFATIEMQAILSELIENFEFGPAPNIEIRRAPSGMVQSMIKGQEDKGTQMPLTVSIISKHDAD